MLQLLKIELLKSMGVGSLISHFFLNQKEFLLLVTNKSNLKYSAIFFSRRLKNVVEKGS